MMAAVWCVNGLVQAFIWSPMIRLMYEYYETETRMKACVSLNSSVGGNHGGLRPDGACDMAVGLEGHVRSGGLGAAGGLSILAPGHEPGGTVRGGIRETGTSDRPDGAAEKKPLRRLP